MFNNYYHKLLTSSMLKNSIILILFIFGLSACSSKQIDISGGDNVTDTGRYLPPDDGVPLKDNELEAFLSKGDFDKNIRNSDMGDILLHFKFYIHKARKTVEKNAERGQFYLPFIREELRKRNMPQELAYLPFLESGYNPLARSPTGALGLWQFVRGTGTEYGMKRDWWSDERHDPYQSTEAALNYLNMLYNMFDDWHFAITSYNAGQGRISRAKKATNSDTLFELRRKSHSGLGKDQLSDEALQYLPRFLAICKIMRNLDELGFTVPQASYMKMSTVSAKPSTDLMALSKKMNMTWDEFSGYNPHFLRYISPPNRSMNVYVPGAYENTASLFLNSPASRKAEPSKSSAIKYKVKRGDTLIKISRRYGVSVSALRAMNPTSEPLKIGQTLYVPRSESKVPSKKSSSANVKKSSSSKKPSTAKTSSSSSKSSTRVHTVKAKETVWSLSRTYGVSPTAILKLNGLNLNTRLKLGQKIKIPAK